MYQKVSEVVIFIFSAGAALLHLLTVSGQARSLKQLHPVTLTAAQKLSFYAQLDQKADKHSVEGQPSSGSTYSEGSRHAAMIRKTQIVHWNSMGTK